MNDYQFTLLPSAVTGVNAAGYSWENAVNASTGFNFNYAIATINGVTASVVIGAHSSIAGISADGTIYGSYYNDANAEFGFIDKGGVITTIDAGGGQPSASTELIGVDAAGTIYGNAVWQGGSAAFTYKNGVYGTPDPSQSVYLKAVSADGNFWAVPTSAPNDNFVEIEGVDIRPSVPGAQSTMITGFTDSGIIVGYYTVGSANNVLHGFIDDAGVYTTVDVPGAMDTVVTGISNSGTAVGYETDSAGINHGFVFQNGTFTIVDVPGADSTVISGITASGEIFGGYSGASGVQGFTATVACYCRSTRILTPTGEVAVEDLDIGDRLLTQSGEARKIKWIGKRSYSGRFILGNKDILPICFATGSLADKIPKRDLWVSPHHAMYLGGVLIEAKDLVNGVSVVQAEAVNTVEYFHIELDSHDIIFAEGALSETFVDDDSREMFFNAHEFKSRYPDTPQMPAQYCAPRYDSGIEVEAVRRSIARRTGMEAFAEAAPLRGRVDFIDSTYVEGWAQNPDFPEAPVCLDIFVDGVLAGNALANRYRQDLKEAGLGSGSHSFKYGLPQNVSDHARDIKVRRSLDGQSLLDSSA